MIGKTCSVLASLAAPTLAVAVAGASLSPTCPQRAFVVLHPAERLGQVNGVHSFTTSADDEQ